MLPESAATNFKEVHLLVDWRERSGNDDSASGSGEADGRNMTWLTEEENKEQSHGDMWISTN